MNFEKVTEYLKENKPQRAVIVTQEHLEIPKEITKLYTVIQMNPDCSYYQELLDSENALKLYSTGLRKVLVIAQRKNSILERYSDILFDGDKIVKNTSGKLSV